MKIKAIKCKKENALQRLLELRKTDKVKGRYTFYVGSLDEWERMPCSHPPYESRISLTENEALEMLKLEKLPLRKQQMCKWLFLGRRSGTWKEQLEQAIAYGDFDTDTDAILARAESINMKQWFAHREAAVQQNYGKLAEYEGEWRTDLAEHKRKFTIRKALEHSIKGERDVALLLGQAKVKEAWMLPAVLGFDGADDYLTPVEHCAILRYWDKQYGLEIFEINYATINCQIKRPPVTKAAAIKLAWEQFWYCPDSVLQDGFGTVLGNASWLLNAKYWHFWWD